MPYEPTQNLLLPHSQQEWLPEDRPADYISVSDTIDAPDLQAFYEPCEGGGPRNQPFHPNWMQTLEAARLDIDHIGP